ncbi:MAG: hypothetical protein ACJ0E8_04170 [Gammaproteobacteria bacterium]
MKLNNFLIFFCLNFLFSCANLKFAEVTPCSFPKETLEKGGLLNRFINKENLDDSYKKYICKDFSGHRLVYPISYSSKMEFTIMGETIILSEKEFRESRITIKIISSIKSLMKI